MGWGSTATRNPWRTRRPAPRPSTRPATPNLYNPVASQNKPGTNPRVDWLDQNMPEWRSAQGYQQTRMANALWDGQMGAAPMGQLPAMQLNGGGGGWGGGGGGGGGGPSGLDQASLDWLLGQIGRGRPQALAFSALDLPEMTPFDTSQYDTARQGVSSGLEAMRGRGNTALDAALAELNRYQNPYVAGPQTANPDQYAAMERMARANNATGALGQVAGEGVQADRAMANAYALMAGNDQARQAANLRALEGDRRMMDTNLGLEQNMLNLGVNMAQAKGKSAWDERARALAEQEALANWQRQNQIADTNVTNRNAWNSGLLATLMQIISARAPETALPADTSMYYAV